MYKNLDFSLGFFKFYLDSLDENLLHLEEWIDAPEYGFMDGNSYCSLMLYSIVDLHLYLYWFNVEMTKSELTDKIAETVSFYIKQLWVCAVNLTLYMGKTLELINYQTAKSRCKKLKDVIEKFRFKLSGFEEEKQK